jgi:butyryl-CoA dehydrogenase
MSHPAGCAFLIEPIPDWVFSKEDFTEEQRAMARTAEEFVAREVLPRAAEIEAKKDGVVEQLLKRAGEIGLLAIEVPEEYGGLGLDKATAMLVSERAAQLASFSISWGAHTGIGSLPTVYFGTPAQKAKYLPKLASGEWRAGDPRSEPHTRAVGRAAKAPPPRPGGAGVG